MYPEKVNPETESRLLVARGWGKGRMGRAAEWVQDFFLGRQKCFGTGQRCWLHSIVNVTKCH